MIKNYSRRISANCIVVKIRIGPKMRSRALCMSMQMQNEPLWTLRNLQKSVGRLSRIMYGHFISCRPTVGMLDGSVTMPSGLQAKQGLLRIYPQLCLLNKVTRNGVPCSNIGLSGTSILITPMLHWCFLHEACSLNDFIEYSNTSLHWWTLNRDFTLNAVILH